MLLSLVIGDTVDFSTSSPVCADYQLILKLDVTPRNRTYSIQSLA